MTDSIAVDIDDTLYSFGELARTVMCDLARKTDDKTLLKGAYASWNEWRTPPDIVGVDNWLRIIDISHEPENILSRTPYSGSVEVLTALAQNNKLLYISNRATTSAVVNATSDWLGLHGFPDGELVCTTESKKPFIADCRYIIDDRPKTLVEFVYDPDWQGEPRVGFGLHFEYNSSLTDVPRIKLAPNWNLLYQFFQKEGLLSREVSAV